MNTSLKSSRKAIFNHPDKQAGKNGLRISPINGDLPSVNTLGTPKISLFSRRSHGIHEACERQAQTALSQQLHPLEFLRLLLEDELLSRKDRTAKALMTKARFRFRADLEDLDLTFHKDLIEKNLQRKNQD